MKKFLFPLLLLFGINLGAQDISISFQSSDPAIPMDSILVTNLRTREKKKLPENVSLLLIPRSTASITLPLSPEPVKIYPNPTNGEARILFNTRVAGDVLISLYNAAGQLLQWNNQRLDPGLHRYRFTLPAAGIYFVSVKHPGGMSGFKTVCTGEHSQSGTISYEGSSQYPRKDETSRMKAAANTLTMVFEPGDILLYSAFSGRNNTIMTGSPVLTTLYAVEFHACTDNDQQSYPVVKIGEQWWMARNMSWLPTVTPSAAGSESSPNYYVYGYEGTSVEEAKKTEAYRTYGVLYNWTAAMNSESSSNTVPSGVKGVCPAGWHLPGDAEWALLLTFLDGENMAGGKMKETLTGTWTAPNSGASNSSGFSALPGGTRTDTRVFYGLGLQNYLWSSTGYSASDAWMRGLYNGNASLKRYIINKQYGLNVRCVKDYILLPTVSTGQVTLLTPTSVLCGGEVSLQGSSAVTEKGVVLSFTPNPTTADTKVPMGTGTGSFSGTLSGLLPNTLYYIWAYAVNSQGIAYGDQISFSTSQAVTSATVTTAEAEDVTTTSALLGGNVTSDGNAPVTERGIVYSLSQNPTTQHTKIVVGSGTGSFSNTITGLSPNTLYYVRAYAINSQGTAYGNPITFTTALQLNPPVVTTAAVTNVTQTSAAGGGNVTSDGNAPVTAKGICWNSTGNPATSDSKTTDGSGTGGFTSSLTGLSPNTLYYVRAYAVNSQGTAYGNQVAFTTSLLLTLPVVVTEEAASVTANSALLRGQVTSDGNTPVTERGVVFGLSQNPTTQNNKIPAGNGMGSYSVIATGLTPNTLFYVRAYAVNSLGTTYGNQVTFTTNNILSPPTVLTADPANITINSAWTGGNVISDGNASVSERGIVYAVTQNPTTASPKIALGTGMGSFSTTLTGLLPGTLYYVRAYAINSQGTSYGEQRSFTTGQVLSLATVVTHDAVSVTTASAILGGNVTGDGNAAVTEKGVVYGTTQNPTTANAKVSMGSGTGSFSGTITALLPNTLYYVRAYATNNQGTAYGNQVSFTTAQVISLPSVTTAQVSGVTQTTAAAGGNVTSDGNALVTARGVCWNTSGNPATAGNKTSDGTGTGTFNSSLSGLTPGTFYFLRAYAVNSQGTAYGDQVTFTTSPLVTLAVVTTAEADDITSSSALLGGNVTSDGNAPVTERGIVYSLTQNPTTQHTKIAVGSGTGSFSNTVTGLTPNTLYYVRAYAINSQGTAYGNQVNFTTALQLTPPVVTTAAVTNVTQTTAAGGGNVTSDGNAPVTAKGICWNSTGNPDTSDSKTTDGSGTGGFTSSLTGLTPNTLYYARAYAINSQGTAYGNQVSFTTAQLLSPPTVTTSTVSEITRTTATCGGNVTGDGNATVTSRGICWNTTGDPTIAGPRTENGTGTGEFTSYMTGLTESTQYYVRAYATNNQGTAYGSELTFFTAEGIKVPTVTTSPVTGITKTTATGGGNVISDGGAPVTVRGVCWNTSGNPTTAGNKTENGTGTGIFSSNLTGLTASMIYYVRAYATNSKGTGYGSEIKFITEFENCGTDATDVDGNRYTTILIGTQCWMCENLKTTKYQDGNPIPNITGNEEWGALTSGAYSWFNNDASANKEAYGALYNWFAVQNEKLCPAGWHVPQEEEWSVLSLYFGGDSLAGGKLKETGTAYWNSPNEGATNLSGFSGRAGGYRHGGNGDFGAMGRNGYWWSSSGYSATSAWSRQLNYNNAHFPGNSPNKKYGFSVRCIRDKATP